MVVLPRWHCKVERGVRYSRLYKSSSVEVPSLGVLDGQDSGLEILLGEGGDVELGARTSEHIIVFAFDSLPLNPLSLFYLCKASFISYHSYCLCCALHYFILLILICLVCLCVPHLYLTTRASYSTSTLI